MHSEKPVGIFDSGIGGLTIVKAVQQRLPNESVIYFGDTAHLPYGDKSPALIREYTKMIVRFLLSCDIKAIIIACNTASATAYDDAVSTAKDTPVLNVVDPAIQRALLTNQKEKHIGIIATKTTVGSGVYPEKIHHLYADAQVFAKPTPLLVPMIEEGWVENKISKDIIHSYLSDEMFYEIDTLILGCTHYPLIKKEVEEFFDWRIKVIDPSQAVAEDLEKLLKRNNMLRTSTEKPQHKFYVSDLTENFQSSTKLFLGKEIPLEEKRL